MELLKKFKKFPKTIIKRKLFVKVIISLVATTLLPLALLIAYDIAYGLRIYPGILISNIAVSHYKPEIAMLVLSEQINIPDEIVVEVEDETFHLPLSSLDFKYNFNQSVNEAYLYHRSGNILYDYSQRLTTPFKPVNIPLYYYYDQVALERHLQIIADQVAEDPVYPSVDLENNLVTINKGLPGKELDIDSARRQILNNLSFARNQNVIISSSIVDPTLNEAEAEILKIRAEKYLDKEVLLTTDDQSISLKAGDLLSFLDKEGYNQDRLDSFIADYAKKTNREPQNAVFVFEEGVVKEFLPAKTGITVNTKELSSELIHTLSELESSEEKLLTLKIPVTTREPDIKTEDANDLGIKELLGRGTSHFKGSIANRIYNIGLASSKFRGVMVAPGEILSFNTIVGDISQATGYKQAYVIKDGRTVLGDGGGVCQVSTTLFRAALNAGLAIEERRAHAYRVTYYEQDSSPGLDATVYSPTVDLKIRNDTPHHILVQTLFDAKNTTLVFEIYGTSDGRMSTITKPVITSSTPPPEDLYVDDPTLPTGTVKQVDWKAWGARVNFGYKVERNGEIIHDETFISNYKPWQSVFLKGTGVI